MGEINILGQANISYVWRSLTLDAYHIDDKVGSPKMLLGQKYVKIFRA